MPLLTPGQTIRDTYLVERLLGEGGFAEVYRVKHRFLGRQAMKVFKAYGATLTDIERDIRESVLLSRLKHPNIVEVFDANVLETEKGPVGYFTMTYMAGRTLEQYRRKYAPAPVPVADAVDIIANVARALAVAHGNVPPVVHRDVKPQNVLLGYENDVRTVKLSDFGLAKAANPLTLLLSSKGTTDFKPPESHFNVDSRASDVWAVGVTLYLLLTCQFPAATALQVTLEEEDPAQRPTHRPASTYNIAVDPELDRIISRCLERDPDQRYADAAELGKALDAWRTRAPAQAHGAVPRHDDGVAAPQASSRPPAAEGAFDAQAELHRAFVTARDPGRLDDAAQILERCMAACPRIREHHGPTLLQWKRGIVHAAVTQARQGGHPEEPADDNSSE